EIGIGLFFGTLCRVILLAVLSAGNIIALQTGIANALSTDPSTAQQAAVSGNFLMAVTLVLIFSTGLDHLTLRAVVGTYAVMPPGQWPALGDVANLDARVVADSFTLALQMAAPFLVYGLVFSSAMGVLARLMPTLQVFFVATPAQLLIGLALLAITLSSLMIWFLDSYERQLAPFLGR
ncbi:MAG TPA: flagellar biosynthetic protein FliR, partial [Dongiaceae bacterium]|nr:flagellar biosynthetic protein FliR [Dongiaceae bacterium]